MIQKLLTFAKRMPWWASIRVGLAVFYLFNVASGSIYSRKLWNMLHDQIVHLPLLTFLLLLTLTLWP